MVNGYRVFVGVDEKFLNVDRGDGYTHLHIFNVTELYTREWLKR